MKISYKYITFLFLTMSTLVIASEKKMDGKYTKEKTIKKEYTVNADALLKVNNNYGNLNITSWNGNNVLIEVHIKTNGNNEEKVQQKLNEITIDFDASSSMVYAKTIFNSSKRWGWNWGRNNNVSMQINYTIKVPIKNSINLSNNYGNIYLDRIDGHAKINCDYGRLEIGELHGKNNTLDFDYTSKSHFGYINSGSIRADYSGFTIEKAGNLDINADYTNSTIVSIQNLKYSCNYGTMMVKHAKNISGTGDYVNINLGSIHGNLNLKSDYGTIKIKELTKDAGNVNIKGDYTAIKVGYNPNYIFDFEIETEYAGVKGKENFEINISNVKSSSKYYKGYYGKENSGKLISINSEYGGVSFYKNK